MTKRETAREAVNDEVAEYATREHRSTFSRLNIRRDGTVDWMEAQWSTG